MSQKPILVVLGPKGVGKSNLLNEIFHKNLSVSDSDHHVTQNQVYHEVTDNKYFGGFVDTVGFDTGKSNFLSVSGLYDRRLVVLYLNNDVRIQTSLDQIRARLGIDTQKVWVVNSWTFNDKVVVKGAITYQSFASDNFAILERLPNKWTTIPGPASHTASRIIVPPVNYLVSAPRPASIKISPQAQQAHEFRSLFPNVADCNMFVRLKMKQSKKSLKKSIAQAFQMISLAEIKDYRKEGDALLSLLLETMSTKKKIDDTVVSEVQTNKTLARFFHHFLGAKEGKIKLGNLYGVNAEVSDETVGNIVEAVLGRTYSLHLFDQLLGFVLHQ